MTHVRSRLWRVTHSVEWLRTEPQNTLHRVQGNLTGTGFRDDIVQLLILLALQCQDNARLHRACVVNDFLL